MKRWLTNKEFLPQRRSAALLCAVAPLREKSLPGAVQDEIRNALQDLCRAIELIEGVAGVAVSVDGGGACFFHAVQGRIVGYIRSCVLAWRFAEILGDCCYVEKVVGDLQE